MEKLWVGNVKIVYSQLAESSKSFQAALPREGEGIPQ
jgi:hypothetical protein